MKPLEFYFDYLSPYAYFAWNRLEGFCRDHEVELVVKPVVFGKLLDHWGHLGPAEIAPKREWLIKSCLFYAKLHNLPFSSPACHPFNSLAALRASLPSISGVHQQRLISAIFDAGWGQGFDIGDTAVICRIAADVGLDAGKLEKTIQTADVKSSLKANTDEAIAKGVFGVPTMVYEKDLFWGNDQFEYLSHIIKGTYKDDELLVKDILNRPRAIDRRR